MLNKKKLLIVEDDIDLANFFKTLFEDLKEQVDTDILCDPEVAFEKFKETEYDLVISDFVMPKMNGLELIKRIREIKPKQRAILITGLGNTVRERLEVYNKTCLAKGHNSVAFFEKPFDLQTTMRYIKSTLCLNDT